MSMYCIIFNLCYTKNQTHTHKKKSTGAQLILLESFGVVCVCVFVCFVCVFLFGCVFVFFFACFLFFGFWIYSRLSYNLHLVWRKERCGAPILAVFVFCRV